MCAAGDDWTGRWWCGGLVMVTGARWMLLLSTTDGLRRVARQRLGRCRRRRRAEAGHAHDGEARHVATAEHGALVHRAVAAAD